MAAIKALLMAAAVLSASGALAAETDGTIYRLSPDEIAKIDPHPAAQTPTSTYDPLFDRSLFPPEDAVRTDRRPHGEVGAFVGSGGSRGVFGTVTQPLGDNGSATFSFENSNYGDYGNRRHRPR